MSDDPREILKAAGVECSEVERYMRGGPPDEDDDVAITADAAILAVVNLAVKYKWQREIQVVGALDYNGAIARLDQLWEEHVAEKEADDD